MASEITITARLEYANSGIESKLPLPPTEWISNASEPAFVHQVQQIGTASHEALDTGDAKPGWIIIINRDATNYVRWGIQDGGGTFRPIGRILAGEVAGPFRIDPLASLFLQANTGACNVEYLLISAIPA